MAVAGYNIAFKIDYLASGDVDASLTLAGRTQDDLTIAARTREYVTKDDQGATQASITGHDITFRATGLIDVTGDGSNMTRDGIIELMLAADSFDFFYVVSDGVTYTGTCIMTNYSESSNSTDDATFTADFRVIGTMTAVASS